MNIKKKVKKIEDVVSNPEDTLLFWIGNKTPEEIAELKRKKQKKKRLLHEISR